MAKCALADECYDRSTCRHILVAINVYWVVSSSGYGGMYAGGW